MANSGSDNIILRITKDDQDEKKCPAFCKAKRLVWPASLLILMAVLGFLAINSKLVGREQRRRLKSFEKGHHFLAKAGELYLEDYVNLLSVMPQPDLRRLEISTTLINKDIDLEHTRNFYHASVRHLHNAAPSLEEIDLIGGYLWNPRNEQITPQLLQKELTALKDTLFAVQDSFMESNITIRLFSFDAVYTLDRTEAEQADYQQLLSDYFQYQMDRISVYYMRFSIPIRQNRSEILLNLSFEPKLKSKETGRQRFLTSTLLKTDGTNSEPIENRVVV